METEEIRAGKFGWDQGGTLNSVVFVFGSNSNLSCIFDFGEGYRYILW